MSYVGIDYGNGTTNINTDTGIRFGVINASTVGNAWFDDAIADYGEPTCPRCHKTVLPFEDIPDNENWERHHTHSCSDYMCMNCALILDNEDVFGDEPIGFHYEDTNHKLVSCLDNDIMVLESPYYTFAQFCSPCVPGAGNLASPMADGIKTYCLGHDWFEEYKAPYPVFDVKTNKEVFPKK